MTQTNFVPHQQENMQIKMVSIEGKVYNVRLQSTLALWTPCYYGHPDNTDSCWIPGKKLQTFWLKQTPNITDLQTPLLVPTRISISTFRHFGRIISVYNIFLPLPLFISVTLVEKWTFWFPFNMILLWNYRITSELDVATCGVANVTSFYSVATTFSSLVANLAPKICDFLLWENVH